MRNVPGSLPVSDAVGSIAVIVTTGVAGAPIVPGDPIAVDAASVIANAPLIPVALRVETGPLLTPAALSKDFSGLVVVDTPNVTPARFVPPGSKRLTASPPVLRPTPDPE